MSIQNIELREKIYAIILKASAADYFKVQEDSYLVKRLNEATNEIMNIIETKE